jgi:hypothetical protein
MYFSRFGKKIQHQCNGRDENHSMNETNSEEKRMESMKLLDNTIRSYREQRYDLELILETAPVSSISSSSSVSLTTLVTS